MEDIEALRRRASRWSLAGDQQLLDTLQSLHEKIVSQCSEANSRLREMVTALDDAGIHLQNVNNKFMSLGNSQFIESRVYDDDVTADTQRKEQPQATPPAGDPHSALVASLQVLESYHEAVSILPDTDSSSSDDDHQYSVVLRPKDVYSSRPLPYVIGSHAWKTKWHAGIIRDESDTESESEQSREREQYSDSEPYRAGGAGNRDDMSTPSSVSWSTAPPVPPAAECVPPHPPAPPCPADVAGELARVLGAAATHHHHPRAPDPHTDSPIEPATARKVYRVDKPAISTVFPDEPPPLPLESDEYSEPDDNIITGTNENTPYSNTHSVDNDDSEPEDIFAELKKKTKDNKPYGDSRKVQSVADDLFGDFGGGFQRKPAIDEITRNSTLSSKQYEPDLFEQKSTAHSLDTDSGTKKPIGGISLFGTNKNNESIGAAILKRKQRKSSDESDESSRNYVTNDSKARTDDNTERMKARDEENKERETDRGITKEKDLINDLFTKTKEVKKNKIVISQNAEVTADIFAKNSNSVDNSRTDESKDVGKKIDLFNDTIFDDIDDIFTSYVSNVNLKEPSKGNPTKSLFDDDSDLFNDNKIKTDVYESQTSTKKDTKSIFDSEDELFREKVIIDEKTLQADKNKTLTSEKATYSETDAKLKVNEQKNASTGELMNENTRNTEKTTIKSSITKETIKAKRLFDSDSDDDDIFTKIKTTNEKQTSESEKSKNHDLNTVEFAKTVQSEDKIAIFGDKDDDENIFLSKTDEIPKINDDKLKLVHDKRLFGSPNLFDEDDDELFTVSSKATKNDEIHSTGLKKDDIFHAIEVMNTEIDKRFEENIFKEKLDQNKHISHENKIDKEICEEPVNKKLEESNDDDWETEDKNYEEDSSSVNSFIPKFVNEKYDTQESSEDKDTTKKQSIESKIGITISKEKALPEITDKHLQESQFEYKYGVDVQKTKKPTEIETKNDKIFASNKHTKQSTFSDDITKSDLFNDTFEQTNTIDLNSSEIKVPEQKISGVYNDLPPEFEKPKEPKKSKNVNALFDDDSDDETFFKKNDTLIDESDKIKVIPSVERILGLFDEPPAIDVDFFLKDTKVEVERKNIHDGTESIDNKHVNYETGDIVKPNTVNKSNIESRSTQKQGTDDPDGTESKNESLETKKIGKLRPISLNINVNTLLPGALSKKQKTTEQSPEQTDGQLSSKSTEDLVVKKSEFFDKIDTKIIKSVSFDEKTDPSILDNKLSKERAKIQVKRRPSTRRARKEAVKISGIDFGEDSTDNSSSVDDYKDKTQECERKTRAEANEISKKSKIDFGEDFTDILGANLRADNKNDTREVLEKPCEFKETTRENKLVTSPESNIINAKNDTLETPSTEKSEDNAENKNIQKDQSTDVKSKVVYILHDEDIFSHSKSKDSKTTDVETLTTENIKKTKILNIIDDDDDFLKLHLPRTESKTSEIKTLGTAYSQSEAKNNDEYIFKDMTKQINEQKTNKPIKTEVLSTLPTNKQKSSLFGDLSDSEEELFGNTKNVSTKHINKPSTSKSNKNVQKMKSKNIFSSDSEDDLFGTKKKEKKLSSSKTKEVEVKKKIEVAKGSLFSDIEDDDLFGTTKKTDKKTAVSKSSSSNITTKPSTSAEPVYEDPLSMLGDDD